MFCVSAQGPRGTYLGPHCKEMLNTNIHQCTQTTDHGWDQVHSSFFCMQQTHLEKNRNTIHLGCMMMLFHPRCKSWFLMNNPISTWKVTSGLFPKKGAILLEESSMFSLPQCRATGGKWPLLHSIGNPALSLIPLSHSCLGMLANHVPQKAIVLISSLISPLLL